MSIAFLFGPVPLKFKYFSLYYRMQYNLEGYDNSSILVVSKNICERLRYILRLKSNYWHMAPVLERKLRSSLDFPFFVRAAVGVYWRTIKKFLRIDHDVYLMRWSKMEKDRSVLEVDHSYSKQIAKLCGVVEESVKYGKRFKCFLSVI